MFGVFIVCHYCGSKMWFLLAPSVEDTIENMCEVFSNVHHIVLKVFRQQMIWGSNFSRRASALIQNAMNWSEASLFLFFKRLLVSSASSLLPFKYTVYAHCSLKDRAGCSINSLFVGERVRRRRRRRQRVGWKGDGRGGERQNPSQWTSHGSSGLTTMSSKPQKITYFFKRWSFFLF